MDVKYTDENKIRITFTANGSIISIFDYKEITDTPSEIERYCIEDCKKSYTQGTILISYFPLLLLLLLLLYYCYYCYYVIIIIIIHLKEGKLDVSKRNSIKAVMRECPKLLVNGTIDIIVDSESELITEIDMKWKSKIFAPSNYYHPINELKSVVYPVIKSRSNT